MVRRTLGATTTGSAPYSKIEDVYYLQQVKVDPDAAPDTRIVRRGRELHEPASADAHPEVAILFIEDLTDASPIAQSWTGYPMSLYDPNAISADRGPVAPLVVS